SISRSVQPDVARAHSGARNWARDRRNGFGQAARSGDLQRAGGGVAQYLGGGGCFVHGLLQRRSAGFGCVRGIARGTLQSGVRDCAFLVWGLEGVSDKFAVCVGSLSL